MQQQFPRSNRLVTREKNELKRRALEMVLVLFYVEDLKHFVADSIRATDRLHGLANGGRLPHGTKFLYQKAWAILVDCDVISQDESDELQRLIDYRNLAAHQTYTLTADVGRYATEELIDKEPRYEDNALERVRHLRNKVSKGMMQKFVLSLSFRGLHFEAAERTYLEELAILKRKLQRQAKVLHLEVQEANATIRELRQSGMLKELSPGHPDQFNRSGQLTEEGARCCRALFHAGASPLVVAHLMRLSLRAATRHHRLWLVAPKPDSSREALFNPRDTKPGEISMA